MPANSRWDLIQRLKVNVRHTEVVEMRRGTCLERADISLVERRAQTISLR